MVSEQELRDMVADSEASIKGDVDTDTGGQNTSDGSVSRSQPERKEQIALATWIDTTLNVRWEHTPNELWGKTPVEGAIRKKSGVKAGSPDVKIYNSPNNDDHYCGVAIELKKPNGYPSDVTDSQEEWLEDLEGCGWYTEVCFGADEAIKTLSELYNVN
jgi:hypothetical protein